MLPERKKHKTSRSHQFLQTFWGVYLFYSKKHCSQRHGFRLVGRADGCLPVAVGFNHTWTPKKADHVGGWESQHEKLATKPFSTRFWFPDLGKDLTQPLQNPDFSFRRFAERLWNRLLLGKMDAQLEKDLSLLVRIFGTHLDDLRG